MSQTRRITTLALSSLAAATGLVPVSAHAAAASTIYVDNTPGLGCSDTAAGAGSKAVPFCGIGAAVAVAGPGSHVIVSGQTGDFSTGMNVVGYWLKAPIVPPSGTPGNPVTIEAAAPTLAIHAPGAQPSFRLDNVHDVVIKGFVLTGGAVATSAAGTSRVAFDGDLIGGGVHLSGATDSSLTRSELATDGNPADGVIVDGGSSGTVFADDIDVVPGQLIVKDAPGTRIVNNTFAGNEVWLSGASTGSVVENNVVSALAVDAAAESGTKADYNHVVHAVGTTNAYFWGSQGYDQADFVTTTGQGVHDTGGPFDTAPITGTSGWAGYYVPGTPAAIDSADSSAPGITATDALGNAAVDDPAVANTGAGPVAHRDRGAVENTGVGTIDLAMTPVSDPATYKTRTFTAGRSGDLWAGDVTYTFDFGDGQRSAAQNSPTTTHTYALDGDYTVTVTAKTAAGQSATTSTGVIVLPRARPDIVVASNSIGSTGNYIMEAQSPSGPDGYVPQGDYTIDWGDGTPVWHGGSNSYAHTVGYGHTYQDPTINPTTTITLVDNAGWQWKWTYTPRTDRQNPPVSTPPSPGGWIAGGAPAGGSGPGNPGGGNPPPPSGGPASTPGRPVVQRLGGSDRYATARTVSAAQWESGRAAAVVLARGDKAPDALAGVPLAARKGGPLLLTDPTALDNATRAEIDRVLGGPGSKKPIYVLGGDSAVSPAIEKQLRGAGYDVRRLSGTDRYGTALAIAGQFPAGQEAILATGLDFPDALAAGPFAAQRDAPIVLSDGPTVASATAAFLRGKHTVDAVGGAAVKAAHTVPGVSVHEYAGTDRFATATSVAAALTAALGHPVTGAGVAYAFNFPDALTGGAYAATAGQPLLLTDRTSANASLLTTVHGFSPTLANVEIFGGTAVVSQAAEDQIARAVNGVEK